jgi:hypothetical protein
MATCLKGPVNDLPIKIKAPHRREQRDEATESRYGNWI